MAVGAAPQTERLGATYLGDNRTSFLLWAPLVEKVEVRIVAPGERVIPMERGDRGYHGVTVEGAGAGSLYMYRLHGPDGPRERPDPASRFQPQDVHGPSQVTDARAFAWGDQRWTGPPLEDYLFYELHVGAYTPRGTFDAIIPHLEYLKELGITALEIMPVAQFPGNRNWGYDGAYPYAVQSSYGGPDGLKRLVNAAHEKGLALVLDVVYNHMGPEGNYLREYGPYFTDRYRTPWGEAINFDGPGSDEVRRFFLENALYWVTEFHVDALRLDAVHAIHDRSASPFLQELAEAVRQRGRDLDRRIHLIAESDLNDARLLRPPALGGNGLSAQWADDFHHALHGLLTGEREGYYQDFGRVGQLASSYRNGYVYTGQYSPSRERRHGNSTELCGGEQFVVFTQNHDQVGNRMMGERLKELLPYQGLKLEAGILFLSPFLPLLFMGQEYGEPAPFQYFISHLDEALVQAVQHGRREEFSGFRWQGELPDPQDENTFLAAKLHHDLRRDGEHRVLLEFYRELIRLRRELPPLASRSKEDLEAVGYEREKLLFLRRWKNGDECIALFNFADEAVSVTVPIPPGIWDKLLDSEDERWLGKGSALPGELDAARGSALPMPPLAFALYARRSPAAG